MTTEIVVPELGESIVEATVANWLKHEGERVSVGEAVVELETDKVDLEVGATKSGLLAHISMQEGEDVHVGDVLGTIEEAEEAEVPEEKEEPEEPEKAEAPEEEEAQPAAPEKPAEAEITEKATPVARRYAQETGIDLEKIAGSGAGGRITKDDIERFIKEHEEKPSAPRLEPEPKPEEKPAPEMPAVEREAREERVRMSRRRRTIARRLLEAQQSTAMLTTFNDVDMSAVIDVRQRRREAFLEQHGVKLGFMSFFVKASIGALKTFPRVNGEIQEDEIVLKHYYDIGIAIGAEDGLVVPVLRDADRKSFAEIEREIDDYIQKTREGRLSIEELQGGTFTITNGGVFGSLLSTPILNPPQSAILGLHRIEERPIAVDGEIVIRPMMYLALSYDHRIVDGREAVQFLVRVKELIEDPETLLLEG
ncbi:MAG: 2-oxoglutarate dehydrogenase complex dihydrolipoyllysine-residue succinyltransferase [Anaerolineales bacterium]|jgi:2-oxoglutarate dehydrogenase E2 component (dihydrolipoamide succinyltransferase)